MVTIKDGCGCDPCDCDWKQKLKEAYSRAIQSVNKIGDNDGSVYFPDGTGFVKLPLPRQSDVAQIHTNTEDIANLKVQNTQLQADITTETTSREEAIAAEASARETAITAEATAREEAIASEASARETKDAELDADIARIDNTDARQDQRIQDNTDRITTVDNDLTATEATVATHNTEIINLQAQTQALGKSIVSDVIMSDGTTAGSVQVSVEREDGAVITSANYKWGRDIGVRLEAGTQAGYIKTVISLSDGTELESNEYKIVEVIESDVYVTAITLVPDMTAGTIGGNISYSNGTTQTINTINVPTAPGVTSAIETLQSRMSAVEQKNTTQDTQISALDARIQAIEDTPGISQFASGKLGTIAGSTADGRVKAEDDGTGSVNGWSNLKSRVSTAESQIVSAQNDINALNGTVSQHTTDISGLKTDVTNIKSKNTQQDQSIAANTSAIAANTSAIAGKVAISQGVANAGKALIVGDDGNVKPDVLSSPKSILYRLNTSIATSSSSSASLTGRPFTIIDKPIFNYNDGSPSSFIDNWYKAITFFDNTLKSLNGTRYTVTDAVSLLNELLELQSINITDDGQYLIDVYSILSDSSACRDDLMYIDESYSGMVVTVSSGKVTATTSTLRISKASSQFFILGIGYIARIS